MEQKPVYIKDKWSTPNIGIAVLGYVICQFILGLVFIYLVAFIYAAFNGLEFSILIEVLSGADKTFTDAYISGASIVNGWGNFLVYITSFVIVTFYMRDILKNDFYELKNNIKYEAWFVPLMTIIFLVITLVVQNLVAQLVPQSNNQSAIVEVLKGNAAVPMIISVVICAPVIEELIYRKAIFSYTQKHGKWVAYVVSIVLFTLPHMLSTTSDINTWLLQCIPYALSAFLLAFIYDRGKHSIYSSIFVHMANNLLAVVMTYITLGVF